MALKHVAGKNKGNIVIYALSTCPWCQKTKKLFNDLGVEYFFVDVDLASETERKDLEKAILKWNPNASFPTIVIDDKKCIIGFRETELREALK